MADSSTATVATTGKAWISSPALDLVVGCGAWSLPLLILAYPIGGGGSGAWAAVFYGLALFFNYPHYMATIYRAYHTRSDFTRYGFYTKTLTALLLAIVIASHWVYALVPWLFTVYVTWSPYHYMGQNFGLSMMFIRRNGGTIDLKDRNALWGSFLASYLMMFLSFHTNPSSDPNVVSLGLPTLLDLFRIPLLFIFLILGLWPLSKLVRRFGVRAMLAPLLLFVTEFLWFVLPTVVELGWGVRLPQTRYSAGILAVMHSAQYLWITGYYAKREVEITRRGRWSPWSYAAVLLVGGMALFVPTPWLASWVLGRDFTTSVLIVAAAVNIHHFILDGVVWKLREKQVASVLVQQTAKRRELRVRRWRWPVWMTRRSVQWAAVALLVLLAGVDQARYVLSVPGGSPSRLAMAAALNPNDAPLQTRLGRSYMFGGNYTGAKEALERAERANPQYASTYLFLGNVAEVQGNPEEAIGHYTSCVRVARAGGNIETGRTCRLRLEQLVPPAGRK